MASPKNINLVRDLLRKLKYKQKLSPLEKTMLHGHGYLELDNSKLKLSSKGELSIISFEQEHGKI